MSYSIAQVQRLSGTAARRCPSRPLVLVERPEMSAVERRMRALASELGQSPASHIMVEQLIAGGKQNSGPIGPGCVRTTGWHAGQSH